MKSNSLDSHINEIIKVSISSIIYEYGYTHIQESSLNILTEIVIKCMSFRVISHYRMDLIFLFLLYFLL